MAIKIFDDTNTPVSAMLPSQGLIAKVCEHGISESIRIPHWN
jgi:hypothetical protein